MESNGSIEWPWKVKFNVILEGQIRGRSDFEIFDLVMESS